MSKISKNCLACWEGYTNSKQKLPRKKKKLLKKIYNWIPEFNVFCPLCRCNQSDYYKVAKKWIPFIDFLNKNEDKINKLIENSECNFEPMSLEVHNSELCLMWGWEDDNGIYCYEGTMRAIYKSSMQDQTWSYNETKSLLESYGLTENEVSNFSELIKNINPKSIQIGDTIEWELKNNNSLNGVYKAEVEVINNEEKWFGVYASYGQEKIPFNQCKKINNDG